MAPPVPPQFAGSERPSSSEACDVDVRIQEPGIMFWSRPDDRQINAAHPDMNDVISRLRQMR
ncbi:hypothetical protein OF83DRAFT_1098338 [Amylostereum chailletii]|nr:hypothetical protein OF83DRAFT_1098338 [Amylostereum chailletii]